MTGQFHTVQLPPGCVGTTFRLSGGGAARTRWRRLVPRQHRGAACTRHSTNVRLTRSSPAQLDGRLHPAPSSHYGAEQGSTPVSGSTIPRHQRVQGAAWWYGPGPALTRGPSEDDLKVDATVDGWWTVAGRRTGGGIPSPDCPLMNSSRGEGEVFREAVPHSSSPPPLAGLMSGQFRAFGLS